MDRVDALALCVKVVRSSSTPPEEQAMLDQITNVIKNYKASQALGDSSKRLSEQRGDDPSTAGAVQPVPLFCLGDFNSEHAASCPIVREPTLEFPRGPTRRRPEWLDDGDEQVKRTVYTWTVSTATPSVPQALSDMSHIKPPADPIKRAGSCPNAVKEPSFEFKVRTVSAPD
ncbi:hypothetical protein T484DRAFT_1740639 [Baffinella frigidus]|nr:hypothetical protein T484DRAFT_1740639 [Cryptophyta sp. CCMP2293]